MKTTLDLEVMLQDFRKHLEGLEGHARTAAFRKLAQDELEKAQTSHERVFWRAAIKAATPEEGLPG